MQNKNLKIMLIIFLILTFIITAETFIIGVFFADKRHPVKSVISIYMELTKNFYNRNRYPAEYILVDENENPVSKVKYSSIYLLKEGFYQVTKNNKTGVIDNNGKIIVPIKFGNIRTSDNSFIAQKKESEKYYIYNTNKKLEIVLKSDTDFSPVILKDNYYVVKRNGKYFILDKTGKQAIKENLGEILYMRYRTETIKDKMVFRINKDNKWGIINIDNEIIIPCEYDEIQTRKIDGIQDGIYAKRDGKWGKINFNNEVITDFIYNFEPQILSEDIYIVPFLRERKCYIAKPDLTPEESLDEKLKIIEEEKKKNEAERLKRIKKAEGDLHVVSVYEGQKEYEYSPQQNWNEHKPAKVTVKVEIKNKPITLLLTSYEPVLWKIEPVAGAKIKKIYFMGYYDSEVKAPKNIKIEKLDKRSYITDNTADKIRDILDKEPKSLQYKYSNDYFFVNGFDGAKKDKKDFINHNSTDQEVKFICRYKHDCILSKDGLEVGYANVGASSTATTNKYYNKGKYYFEAQLIALGKNLSWMDTGIISNNSEEGNYCSFYSLDEEEACYPYGVVGNGYYKRLKNNDIIGYAVDFDNGKIYVSLNGVWHEDCIPAKEKTTFLFKNDGREYSAAVEAGQGIKWIVNLGAKKFRYKMPKGFRPYDEYSANLKKVNLK